MSGSPDSAPNSGTAIVPIGSMWAIGDSVSRPCSRGIRSPSRSATNACPNSWTETETTNAITANSATRTWSAEMSTPRRLPDQARRFHQIGTFEAICPQGAGPEWPGSAPARSAGVAPETLQSHTAPAARSARRVARPAAARRSRAGAAAARGPTISLAFCSASASASSSSRMPSSRRPRAQRGQRLHLHQLDDVLRLHRQLAALRDQRVEFGVALPPRSPSPTPSTTRRSVASSSPLARPAASASV